MQPHLGAREIECVIESFPRTRPRRMRGIEELATSQDKPVPPIPRSYLMKE